MTAFRQWSFLRRGSIRWEEDRPLAAELTLRFAAGFLLARGGLMWGIHPFGMAFAAASPPGAALLAGLAGCLLGAATLGELLSAAINMGGILLAASLVLSVRRGPLAEERSVPTAAAGVSAAVVGILRCILRRFSAETLAAGLLEVLFAAVSADLFRLGLRARAPEATRATLPALGGLYFAAAALSALAPLRFLGSVSLGRLLSISLTQLLALVGGPGPGAVSGALLGLAMDLSEEGGLLYGAALAASGAVAGALRFPGPVLWDRPAWRPGRCTASN